MSVLLKRLRSWPPAVNLQRCSPQECYQKLEPHVICRWVRSALVFASGMLSETWTAHPRYADEADRPWCSLEECQQRFDLHPIWRWDRGESLWSRMCKVLFPLIFEDMFYCEVELPVLLEALLQSVAMNVIEEQNILELPFSKRQGVISRNDVHMRIHVVKAFWRAKYPPRTRYEDRISYILKVTAGIQVATADELWHRIQT